MAESTILALYALSLSEFKGYAVLPFAGNNVAYVLRSLVPPSEHDRTIKSTIFSQKYLFFVTFFYRPEPEQSSN